MPCVRIEVREPAEFYVTDLRVEPAEPTTADQIEVFAKVCNSGEVDGYATIQVTLDGNVIRKDKLYVAAGRCHDIKYTMDNLPAGEHEICVDTV